VKEEMWSCSRSIEVFLINEYFELLADDKSYMDLSIQYRRDQLNLTPLMRTEYRFTGLGGRMAV